MKKFILFLCMVIVLVCAGVLVRYPLKNMDIIRQSAEANGLNTAFVCAVIHAESKFDNMAVSAKNAKGLMQLTEQTADWLAADMELTNYDYQEILNPEINIPIGCYYLRKLLDQYGNVDTALAAYNAGSGNVSEWLADSRYSTDGQTLTVIPFPETAEYVKRVDFNTRVYELLLNLPITNIENITN